MKKNNIFAQKKSKIAERAVEMKIIHAFTAKVRFGGIFATQIFSDGILA